METNNGATLRPASKTKTTQMSNAKSHSKQLIPINAKLPPACLQGKATAHLCSGYLRPQVVRNVHYTLRFLFALHLDCFFLLSKHLISHTHYSRLITLVINCSLRRPAFFLSQVAFKESRTRCGPRRLNRYGD
jgi:hypothetical protein